MANRQKYYCLSAIAFAALIAGIYFIYSSYYKHASDNPWTVARENIYVQDQATQAIARTVSTGTQATHRDIESNSPLFYYETIFKNDIVEIKFREDGTLMRPFSEINGNIFLIYTNYDDRIDKIINSLTVAYSSPTLGNKTVRISTDLHSDQTKVDSTAGRTWIQIKNVYQGGLSSSHSLPIGIHKINIRISNQDGTIDTKYFYEIRVRER